MRKRNLLYAALILAIVVSLNSCFHDHDLSININDDDDVYRMRASFDDELTNKVQGVINTRLKEHHSHGLVTIFTDKEIVLEDGTRFYIKSSPGKLKIKLDRSENSEEGYENVIEICDEVKDVLADNEDN